MTKKKQLQKCIQKLTGRIFQSETKNSANSPQNNAEFIIRSFDTYNVLGMSVSNVGPSLIFVTVFVAQRNFRSRQS